MICLPCDTKKHNKFQTCISIKDLKQCRTNQMIRNTNNHVHFGKKMCDIPMIISYMPETVILSYFFFFFILFVIFILRIIFLNITWKQTNRSATIILSPKGAWIFSRHKSYRVRPKNNIHPNMWLHIFTVSFVHQNILK